MITCKQVRRNAGNSGRINVSGSELAKLDLKIGDVVDVEAGDATAVAHALIDSKNTYEFLIETST